MTPNPYKSPTATRMSESVNSRWPSALVAFFPISVIAWTCLFYSYVLRVVISLGHMPRSIAEHGGLDSGIHWRITSFGMTVMILFFPLWTIGYILTWMASDRHRARPNVISMIIGWGIALFITQIDPGGFFVWFLD